MFIHLWDVHFDFVPPPPYDTMFDPDYEGTLTGEDFFRNPAVNPRMSRADLDHILALYDGEIAWTDYHIGLILDDLAERGLMENTIVALVSDHGEEFFEHQGKGHRFTLYDEVIRIPMILWYPKKIPAGTRVEKTTSIVDIFPTLLELSGAAPSAQPMGRSLVPLINHDPRSADKLAISELNTLGQDIATFRSVDRKMRVDNATGNAWSYDLRIDPRERLGQLMRGPVSDWERDMLAETKQLRGWLRERKQRFPKASVAPQLSDALVEQLKLLGYLEEETPETSSRE
jgi:arylsulfatase A-like enzyme